MLHEGGGSVAIEPCIISTVDCTVVLSHRTRHLYCPMSEATNALVHFNRAETIPGPGDVCSEDIPLGRGRSFLSHCTVGGGHAKPLHLSTTPV